MYGLTVNRSISLSGHPLIINKINNSTNKKLKNAKKMNQKSEFFETHHNSQILYLLAHFITTSKIGQKLPFILFI